MRQTISKWENGQAVPELNGLILLSELYGVTIDRMVKGSDARNISLSPGAGLHALYPNTDQRNNIVSFLLAAKKHTRDCGYLTNYWGCIKKGNDNSEAGGRMGLKITIIRHGKVKVLFPAKDIIKMDSIGEAPLRSFTGSNAQLPLWIWNVQQFANGSGRKEMINQISVCRSDSVKENICRIMNPVPYQRGRDSF